MNDIQPVATFRGRLIDRSHGRAGLGAPSSRELMDRVPAWTQFIQSVTGWDRVEHGTLTLDDVRPLPLLTLANIDPIGIEPEGIFDSYSSQYGQLMRQRGTRRFYGVVARNKDRICTAAVSQQETPAVQDRLEVYSFARLRDALQVQTGSSVAIDAYHRDDWFTLFGNMLRR